MKYILAVFSTRKDALAFFDALRRNNFYAAVVNTPREVSSSCGISVKINANSYNAVKAFAYSHHNFTAFYAVEECGSRRNVCIIPN